MFRLPGNFVRKRADSEPIDDSTVLFWTDILLVCVLGLFIIVSIPRAVARFGRRSEWWKGFLVGYSKVMDDGASSITRINGAMSEKKSTMVVPPTHVQALPTRFFSLGCFLRSEIIPDFHVARTLLMLLYFGVLLFAALYKGSIFKSSPRDGVLVASQLPWVYILATKNNAIGTLIGYGYEKLNVFHRWAGILTILAANVHALGFIYSWVMQGIWTARLQDPTFRWGLVALVSIDLLFLSSLSYIRHHYYNLFFYTHSTAMIVLLIAVPIHQPFAIPYIAIAAAFYGADRVLRVVKSRMTVAYLQTIPDLGTTLVTMPRASGGWRAGQHIRIRVLKGDMILETHPFTIACACEGQKDGLIGIGGADGMILMVKKAGDWTRKLYDLAAQADMEGGDAESSVMGRGTRVKVLVDGPYGGPGYTLYDSFSGVLLSAGGSGISFVLAIAQELLQRATVAPGSTNTRAIEIVWSIQHPRALSPLIPLFIRMLELSRDSDITLKIRVSYTRALLPDDERHFAQNLNKEALPEGLSLTAGRVHMRRVLSEFADRTSSSLTASGIKGHGIALAVCGPASLGKDVASAMATLGAEDRNAVGGVEFYEEAFHW